RDRDLTGERVGLRRPALPLEALRPARTNIAGAEQLAEWPRRWRDETDATGAIRIGAGALAGLCALDQQDSDDIAHAGRPCTAGQRGETGSRLENRAVGLLRPSLRGIGISDLIGRIRERIRLFA